MRIHFSPTAADQYALSRVVRTSPPDPAPRLGRGVLGWVLLGVLAVATPWLATHRPVPGGPVVRDEAVEARNRGLILFGVVSGLAVLALNARHRRRNAVQRIVIDRRAGLTISTRRRIEQVPWAAVDRFVESADHFFLHRYPADGRWITIPVRGLADAGGERDRLRALLQAHVTPQSVGFPVVPARPIAA